MELQGRKALVTGGAVRVGRTLALRLAALGADVAILTREAGGAADDTARKIAALGARAAVVTGDLLDAETPSRAVAETVEALGGMDILVNNAAVFDSGGLADLELDTWSRMQRINLRAPLLLARAFAAALPPDRDGDIVNLNDVHALRPRGGYVAYTHSKAALHALTRNLAAALAPRIRVNEIALGAVLPPAAPPDGYAPTRGDDLPLRRFPTPEDVADALEFMLRCRAVTGQTISIDGGEHLGG